MLKAADYPCCVERAKSARSTVSFSFFIYITVFQCNVCKIAINKGYLRIGQQWNPDHSGYYWYHTWCFRNWPKEAITPEDFFIGFETLDAKGKVKIRNLLQAKLGKKKIV